MLAAAFWVSYIFLQKSKKQNPSSNPKLIVTPKSKHNMYHSNDLTCFPTRSSAPIANLNSTHITKEPEPVENDISSPDTRISEWEKQTDYSDIYV